MGDKHVLVKDKLQTESHDRDWSRKSRFLSWARLKEMSENNA